jgi:tetratricopeptide (TPR) repeat protein
VAKIIQPQPSDRPLDIANNCNELGIQHHSEGRYDEALLLLERALGIRKLELGDRHPDTATSLNNLASLYYSIDRYLELEELLIQVLDIFEELLGHDHPNTKVAQENPRSTLSRLIILWWCLFCDRR